MNPYLRLHCVVGLALFIVLIVGCGKRTAAQDPGGMDEETRAKMELMRQMMMLEFHGDIVISGQITDENGEQLDEVRVTGHYQWMNDQTGGVTKIDTAFDGAFAFSVTNCHVLELEFEKEGYYRTKLVRVASEGEADWGGRKKMEEHDINVVLERQGDLTELAGLQISLEFDSSGKATVAEMVGAGKLSKTEALDLNQAGSTPDHGMYLETSTSESMITVVDNTNVYGQAVGVLPLRAILMMCGNNDGFVMFTAIAENENDNLRRMKSAPDVGYVRELAINPETSNFFYFKIGSLYGKGYVGPVHVKMDKSSCRCSLRLYLQKDGSRNLESLYY